MRHFFYSVLCCALMVGTANAQVEIGACEEPNVLIVLDRSGSMREGQKWQQATDAVVQLTRSFEHRIRFGLMVFPWNGECRVRGDEALRAPVAPLNAQDIQMQLGGASPERRNNTPIGQALREGTNYFIQLRDQGRRSFVVLITDGQETCNGDPVREAQATFDAGFPVFVIGFGRGVDQRTLDRMADRGGTNAAFQANDGRQLFDVLELIADQAGEEICDGKDNDCDGTTDESAGEETCTTACGIGHRLCVDGTLSECLGGEIPAEECNNLDDDCDGQIDEVESVPCTTNSGNPGTAECLSGGEISEECEPDDPDAEEICDSIDNDMDGFIDEGTDQPCEIECHTGRRLCVEGSYIRCTAAPVMGEELCDGTDSDCDGRIDEMAECVGAETCGAEGECLRPCPFNECPDHFTCAPDGFCHPNLCNPFCDAEQRCVREVCYDVCLLDRDCPTADFHCENRLCIPGGRSMPGNGPGGAGGSGGGAGGQGGSGGILPPPPTRDGGLGGGGDDPPPGCACDATKNSGTTGLALLLLLGLSRPRRRREDV